MTRSAKVGLAALLLLISAACLVGPSHFQRGSDFGRGRPECKRCPPPPPPDPHHERLTE